MKLARYWTREPGEATGADGHRVRVTARGWSNESLAAARELARSTARRLAERLVAPRAEPGQYLYGERPLPEPILREFRAGAAGDPGAVVTRNAYGALVLNARHLMFVDIDRDDAERPVLAAVGRVAEADGLAARVYKTAAGYRAIITSAHLDAGGASSEALLRQFGADPLYVRLCRLQESFRARLTPKPWRCGLRVPPVSFPFDTPREESRFRAWEADYASTAARYATCRYLATVGDARVAPGFEELIGYHDRETRATTTLPLA
jgi:hypothetical protein